MSNMSKDKKSQIGLITQYLSKDTTQSPTINKLNNKRSSSLLSPLESEQLQKKPNMNTSECKEATGDENMSISQPCDTVPNQQLNTQTNLENIIGPLITEVKVTL